MQAIKSNIRLLFVFWVICFPLTLAAQMSQGVTGLLTIPSAEMQADGTAMIGGNYLNQELTPPSFPYNTLNYFLNVTILPFAEVAYTCTMFRKIDGAQDNTPGGFVNQDRSLSLRFRVFRERKYRPAIVVGSNDIYTSSFNQFLSTHSNQYFSRIYVATSKHFDLGDHQLGAHLVLSYNRRSDVAAKYVMLGASYRPSFAKNMKIVAEYDSDDWFAGVSYLFFNHLFLQGVLQNGRYLSAGIAYKIYLK